MRKITGLRPAGVQRKKEKKCARRRKRERNGGRGS